MWENATIRIIQIFDLKRQTYKIHTLKFPTILIFMFFKIEVKTRHDQQLWASAKGTDPKMHKPGCYMQKIRGKEI